MTRGVGIGVLGVGRMGLVHCEQIQATPGLRLVAASSRAPSLISRARALHDIRTYNTHEELLGDEEIEWVVIATRTDSHAELAMRALERGKELIVEKPLTLEAADAEAIYEDAARKGLRVIAHHNRRWDPDFKLVQDLVSGVTLGQVYRIESRYTDHNSGWGAWGAEGEQNPWRLKGEHGGGLLNDWGAHLVDQMLLVAGTDIRTVTAKTDSRVWSTEVDDHFWAELLFADGRSARVEASNNHWIPLPRWVVLGTEGTLQVEGGSPVSWNSAVARRSAGGSPEEIRYDITRQELSTGFYEQFAYSLKNGHPLPVEPAEVLRVMRLLDAIRRSANEGRSIEPQL